MKKAHDQKPYLPYITDKMAHTVREAMVTCGLNDVDLFDNKTAAERFAEDVFSNDFNICIDKTMEEVQEDLKIYSSLTQAQGQIRITPGVKTKIQAFIQWARDQIRMGLDPALQRFPVADIATHIMNYKSHYVYTKKSKVLIDTAKPTKFRDTTKWEDWYPSFVNFLRCIPGRNGVPLCYICRDKHNPLPYDPNIDFMENYIQMTLMQGEAYRVDAKEVHTYLTNFVAGNDTAEVKMLPHADEQDGRLDIIALKDHYEGTGVNALNILRAEDTIKNVFYTGEKKPTMWWEEFEKRLTQAFAVIDRKERRQVYSNEMKLRLLTHKINVDFLNATKAAINIELTKTPMTMVYEQALAAFRNEVNRKHPPQVGSNTRTRRVNEVGRGTGRGFGRGYGRGRGRGFGRGGRGGRSTGRGHREARFVTGNDGRSIEVHPSYKFPPNIWENLPNTERKRILEERRSYRENKMPRRNVSETQSVPQEVGINAQQDSGTATEVSNVTNNNRDDSQSQPPNIMGGRNAQSVQTRRLGAVRTSARIVSRIDSNVQISVPGTSAANEMDSNADTCCLGSNFVILSYTNRTADVFPYDDSYEPMTNVPIVTGVTKFHHEDGNEYILVINEALYYGKKLNHSLINPNQIRHYGHDLWDNPYDKAHELEIDTTDGISIPMKYHGTKLSFNTTAPTEEEINVLKHIHLTSKRPWEPNLVSLGEVKIQRAGEEFSMRTRAVVISEINGISITNDKKLYSDCKSDEATLYDINPPLSYLKEILTLTNGSEAPYDASTLDVPSRRTFVSTDRHKKATIDQIADKWCIGPIKARNTIRVTTQRGTRSAILPISRRYRADRYLNEKRLNSKFATDTIWADTRSLNQHKYAQAYTHKCGFAACYPMDRITGDQIGYSLQDFVSNFGVPEHLTFDAHASQVGKDSLFMKNVRKYNIKHHVSGVRRPNENPAEGGIREIKRRWYRIMNKKNVPKRLWDYGLVWTCETGNLCASSSRYANNRSAIEIITGETPDISEYIDFGFYDWVTYRTNAGLGELSLGRWLGVSHKIGQAMSYWILTVTGRVISCTTVQRLTNLEQSTDEWKDRMERYTTAIQEHVVNVRDVDLNIGDVPQWNQLSLDLMDQEFNDEMQNVMNDETIKEADEIFDARDDPYLNMEIGLPRGEDGEREHAIVKRRAIDVDGKPVGKSNTNPILDSSLYEVEYIDGTVEIMPANLIAENLLAQVDEEGHRQMLMEEIIDHRKTSDAIEKINGFMVNKSSNTKRRVMTTKGWHICVQWKDGSTSWVTLKDLKNAYPIELANYAIENKIDDEPAFAWWVPYTKRKVKQIMSKIKSKYWQKTHKYGIRIPKSVDEAYEIDHQEKSSLWTNAINEEMPKIKNAVRKFNGNPKDLVGYQEITGHMIFDIKLGEGFRRKARFVADGHKTKTPPSVTYSSVVSRDSVRICLLIAALNDLDIQGADIENAYLTAPNREKVWLRAGREFGDMQDQILIVEKALYGLKSSGAAFRAFLAETLDRMGFTSTEADPDVWIRPASKPDGEEYYEYVMCYVDDVLGISADAVSLLQEIQKDFKFKKNKIEPPEFYLGAKIEKKTLGNREMYTICSRDYAKLAVQNIEKRANEKGLVFSKKVKTPMTKSYIPEMDTSDELDSDGITFYQEVIGILRWMIEIGRVDILTEVSLLSSYQAAPRKGHLMELLNIVAYVKKRPKLTLYFDPNSPNIDESIFIGDSSESFKEHYREAEEVMPERMPKPRGKPVTMTAFVDASHASDRVTRRSHTGFIIFLNRAPIIWYSKKQNTIESSAFSSEFVAMRICTEQIVAMRFKLRMFGVPIDGPCNVLSDNSNVVNNTSKFDSVLNKRHASIAYHSVRWCVAANVLRVAWIATGENLADAMTKRLPESKRDYLFGNWTY